MADESEYLTPGFDANGLTVPRLRSILLQHDVDYPSSAKKGQLIEIFNENIAPQAKRILKSRANTKRSTRGIEDVPSSREASVATTEEEEEESAPMTSPRRSTARRSARQSTFGSMEDDVAEETPRTVRASSRKSIARPIRLPAEDAAVSQVTPRSPSRRSRQSMATPAIKVEDHDEPSRDDNGSPFSTANPFQSGSPPYIPPSTVTKRRSLAPSSSRSEPKSASSRRKTDVVPANQLDLTDWKQITRKRMPKEEEEEEVEPEPQYGEVEAGEEFTPEEQQELEVAEARSGQALTRPAKRRRNNGPTHPLIKVAPWAISLAMLSGFGAVWRQEKLEVGYCGVGKQQGSLAGVQIPDWASALQPQCEPCPPHAYCYGNLELSCEPDFVMKPHPLAFAGLVPLPPTCEPDGEKARKVKTVADRAVEELRERNAKWECGELRNEQGKRLASPEVQEPDLKKVVETQKKRSMSQEEFEDLWAAAIGDIVQRDEVQHGVDGHTSLRTLRSTSLAHISLSCAARRSVRLTLERYLRQLVLLILLAASASYGRYALTTSRTTDATAKQLATVTLERLANQAAWARGMKGSGDEGAESFISVAQLRDDVLREEFSSKRRQQLWHRVQMKVEGNSNVRSMIRESSSGEVGRVWEWIGSVGAIESPQQRRISGGRTPVKEEMSEMEESLASIKGGGKFDRPIY